MATLKDVAEKVGVSITTVSRVMNGRGAISRETRDKVFAAMKELNYFPNEMARSLGNKSSHLIGLIVPYIDHAFFGILTAAIEEACYKSGYKLFFCTSGGNPNRERELFTMLCANNVAGVLVCSRITDKSLYMQTDVPIVTIERMIEDVPSVSCDNYKGGVLAAQELLLASDCKSPLLFGNRIISNQLPASLRYKGFQDACARNGSPCSEYYIDAEDLFGKNLGEDVYKALKQFPETDGIFATSDVLAARIMNTLNDADEADTFGRIPVIGFDGVDISAYCEISTIAQPIRQMGALAVQILIQRINGQIVPERSILPVSLIRRKTSGPNFVKA